MDDPPASLWLTYRELAIETGLSVPAAEARARRMVKAGKWRHRVDNSPPNAARVLVTPADLAAMRDQSAQGGTEPLAQGRTQGAAEAPVINALLTELKAAHERIASELERRAAAVAQVAELTAEVTAQRERAARAEAAAAAVPELREKAARAEGERDALQEVLRAAQAGTEEAGQRARIAEERAAAAHQRAAEVTTVMGRVAEGLEHIRQTQAAATEAVAAAKAEREAAQARVEEAVLRVGEAEARAAEASRRAEAAEARLDELQRLPAEAAAPDPTELEAAQARAAEAERQAAEARRRADEAERRATTANERWDRFQQRRIAEAQEAAIRAADTPQVASPEAKARRPFWRRWLG
jgi:chromosome segregation ATPase